MHIQDLGCFLRIIGAFLFDYSNNRREEKTAKGL